MKKRWSLILVLALLAATAFWVALSPTALYSHDASLASPRAAIGAAPEQSANTPTPLMFLPLHSFDAPSPGVYAMIASNCASRASLRNFEIWRTNYAGISPRQMQLRPTVVNSDGSCSDQFITRSNLVANETHLYWIWDNYGLVRVPVTASNLDYPEFVLPGWIASDFAELKIVGDMLFAAMNNNNVPFINAYSSLEAFNTRTGELHAIVRIDELNAKLSKPSYDGRRVFYLERDLLVSLNLDGTDHRLHAGDIVDYDADGLRPVLPCSVVWNCGYTQYVYAAQNHPNSAQILRIGFHDASFVELQRRDLRRITSITVAPVAGISPAPERRRVVVWSEYHVIQEDPSRYVYSLQRALANPNEPIANLYNLEGAIAAGVPIFANLVNNDDFLLWRQGNAIMRLPVDVAGLPQVDMLITGMEVTQAVQNATNDVRPLEGRNTYVRVFVRGLGGDVPGVTMRLEGPTGPALVPINRLYLRVKGTPNHNLIDDSFVFLLPLDWTRSSPLKLTATLNPTHYPMEPSYTNNTWTESFYFDPAHLLRLTLVSMSYTTSIGGTTTTYNVTDLDSHVSWLNRTYPVAEGGLEVQWLAMDGGADLGAHVLQTAKNCLKMAAKDRNLCASGWVMAQLRPLALDPGKYGVPLLSHLYGLIDDGAVFVRGQAGFGGNIGAGPTGGGRYGYYTAHELGHMLGRDHVRGAPPCDRVDHVDPNYRYPNAQIGPNSAPQVYGFDRARSGAAGGIAVLDDAIHFDFMSYCNPPFQWISPYTWTGIYDWLKRYPESAQAAQVENAGAGDFIGLFGSAYDTTAIVYLTTRTTTGTATLSDSAGKYELRLLSASSQLLSSLRFAPNAADEEGESFAVVAPLPAGATTIQVVRVSDGAVVHTEAISPNAPQVSGVALQGAPNPVSGTVTLQWTASDADGGALTSNIYYTRNNGASWQPVAFAVSGTSTQIDTSSLGGGTAKFKVETSDGVNLGSGESAPFQMAAKPPTVAIMSPADGSVSQLQQMLLFEGYAWDAADASSDLVLEWSNQHGVVATGATATFADLPPGPNTLTLKATNSAGLSASTSVSIFVGDAQGEDEATAAAAPGEVGFHFASPSSAQESATVELVNVQGEGALPFTVTDNQPWLAVSPSSGTDVPAMLTVTVNPAGLQEGKSYVGTVTVDLTQPSGAHQLLEIPVYVAVGNVVAGVPQPQPTPTAPSPSATPTPTATAPSPSATPTPTATTTSPSATPTLPTGSIGDTYLPLVER